jgi:hypothetical protein
MAKEKFTAKTQNMAMDFVEDSPNDLQDLEGLA